ncbi:MAG: hypothetical protein AMK72_14035 [Planctomycetes bacterium SM23_25]|nr:MAG: hypothetical protein AMK72_14035 [Planctomycetes bacterium SM23_25]
MAQIGRKVGSQRDLGALPVLLIGGVENGVGMRPVKLKLPDRQRSQLAPAKPGQHECLVDQGAFPSECAELPLGLRPELGDLLALVLAPPNCRGVEHRAPPRHVQ